MIDPETRTLLSDRLDSARQQLMAALEGLTERDFATDVGGGETVVRLLANLAGAEHRAVVQAGGGGSHGAPAEKPLPPQVVHDLAGVRYRMQRALEGTEADKARMTALVVEVERLEAEAAARIRNRPPAPPAPPQIPVIQR